MTSPNREVFFLPVEQGQRLCIYTPPATKSPDPATKSVTGCVLHIHAFAEEMNKSRRMAALTASSLAERGMGVLQMDLYGCGDSSADFADATWEIWKSDVVAGLNWLKQKHSGEQNLWGDRLGALLALDLVCHHDVKIDRLLLCQPVLDGQDYLQQLGRIQQARTMLNQQNNGAANHQEIAGYEISRKLSNSISQLEPAGWTLPGVKISWLEMTLRAPPALSAKRQAFLDNWMRIDNAVQLQLVTGPSYWSSPEVVISEEWVHACSNLLMDRRP